MVVTTYYSAQDLIIQEGVQAWVDFQCETTRCDVIVEMIEGLTAQMRRETALLRRRLRRPMPWSYNPIGLQEYKNLTL